jgi:hypothetical protein
MSEVDSSKLAARLHDAIDDHPVDVPDLLTPARSRRTRRRVLGGTAAVAVVVAGALAASQLLSVTPRTALVAATPSPTVSSTPEVTPSPALQSNDTIAVRCGPQMVKYDALPQLAGVATTWHVAHQAHSYGVGDLVAMVPGNPAIYTAYCRIPAAGHESDAVSFKDLEAASLTTLDRVAVCSESMSISDASASPTPAASPSADFPSRDLRGATIFATASAGNTMVLLLSQGTTSYSCILYPQPWVDGGVHMYPLDGTRGLQVGFGGFTAGAADTSVVPVPGTYYFSVGRLPAGARTIEFTISKKVVATVTANADGWWVAAFMVEGRDSLAEPSTYAIKDAAGTVLKTANVGS